MIGGYTQPQLDYLQMLGQRQMAASAGLPAQIGENLQDALERRRFAQLYVQSHFPQYSTRFSGAMNPPVAPSAPVARMRMGRGRRGYGTYSPQSTAVNIGGAVPAAAPVVVAPPARTAQVVYPNPAWSYPMSAEEVVASQRETPVPLMPSGVRPTSAGYMFTGTKEDFAKELERRDDLLAAGYFPEELYGEGAPSALET